VGIRSIALIAVLLLAMCGGGLWLQSAFEKEPKRALLVGMAIPPKIVTTGLPPRPSATVAIQPTTKPRLELKEGTNPEPNTPEFEQIAATPAEPVRALPVETAAVLKPARIAIVIDDAGIDVKRTRRAIALPVPLTLAFLVYGNDIASQASAAAAAGHELLVHVNMEAESRSVDPGPNVLLRNVEPDVNLKRLNWMLDRFQGYVGVNNHMGSKFTTDPENMTLILKEIKRRNLLFLDSRTSPKTVGGRIARSLGIPTAARDVFLDNDPDPDAVNRKLAKTEAIARRTGAAIAIGHPKDATLDALARWLPAARARGIKFVPVSALAWRVGEN